MVSKREILVRSESSPDISMTVPTLSCHVVHTVDENAALRAGPLTLSRQGASGALRAGSLFPHVPVVQILGKS